MIHETSYTAIYDALALAEAQGSPCVLIYAHGDAMGAAELNLAIATNSPFETLGMIGEAIDMVQRVDDDS